MEKLFNKSYYIAPEIIKGEYDEKCDIWSCGIIFYILLAGYPPFYGKDTQDTFNKILNNNISFHKNDFESISKEAKILIRKFLTKNPNERITLKEIFDDPWIKNNKIKKNIDFKNLKNLENFNNQSKLKTVLINFFATRINFDDDKNEMLETFQELDKNGDGVLNKEEFINGFKEIYPLLNEEEIIIKVDNIFKQIDENESGEVDFSEFINVLLFNSNIDNYNKMREAFKLLDSDGSGYLEKEEIQELFNETNMAEDKWKEYIKEIDKDRDGKISFDEFMILLKNIK